MEKGVRATSSFKSGTFICEFEGTLLTKEQFEAAEKEYQEKNLPVYGLEVNRHTFHLFSTFPLLSFRLMATISTPPFVLRV